MTLPEYPASSSLPIMLSMSSVRVRPPVTGDEAASFEEPLPPWLSGDAGYGEEPRGGEVLDVVAVKPAEGGGEEPIREDLSDPRVLGEVARIVCVVGIEGEVGTAKPP